MKFEQLARRNAAKRVKKAGLRRAIKYFQEWE
jgi:hypothetical protein